jgi:hypothetical protein
VVVAAAKVRWLGGDNNRLDWSRVSTFAAAVPLAG